MQRTLLQKRNKYFVTIAAVKGEGYTRIFNIARLIFIQHLKYKNTRRKTPGSRAREDIKFRFPIIEHLNILLWISSRRKKKKKKKGTRKKEQQRPPYKNADRVSLKIVPLINSIARVPFVQRKHPPSV